MRTLLTVVLLSLCVLVGCRDFDPLQPASADLEWVATNPNRVFANVVAAPDGALLGITEEPPRRVMRSTDRGESWSVSLMPPTDAVEFTGDLVTGGSGRVYVAVWSLEGGFANRLVSLLRSDDAGQNWQALDQTWEVHAVTGMAVSTRGYVFLATQGQGVQGLFRSTDEGETWSATVLTSDPSSQGSIRPRTLAAGPAGRLTASFLGGEVAKTGTYLSQDDGDSWQRLGNSTLFTPSSYGFDAEGDLVVTGTTRDEGTSSVDIFVSRDRGINWIPGHLNVPGLYDAEFAITPGDALLVAASYEGVYRSTDRGQTWTVENAGLPVLSDSVSSVRVTQVLADADGFLYANTTGGLYRSKTPVRN